MFLVLATVLTGAPLGAAPVPAPVKDCVAFIFLRDAAGHMVPQGTAFFVQVPSET